MHAMVGTTLRLKLSMTGVLRVVSLLRCLVNCTGGVAPWVVALGGGRGGVARPSQTS